MYHTLNRAYQRDISAWSASTRGKWHSHVLHASSSSEEEAYPVHHANGGLDKHGYKGKVDCIKCLAILTFTIFAVGNFTRQSSLRTKAISEPLNPIDDN